MTLFLISSRPSVGELSSDLGAGLGMSSEGSKTADEDGRELRPRLVVDAEDVERLASFLGSSLRTADCLGLSSFKGESSSGSSGTTSTVLDLRVLDGRGRFDIRITFDRLWPL